MGTNHRQKILDAVRAAVGDPSFVLEPKIVADGLDVDRATRDALELPVGISPLRKLVSTGDHVLLLVDDITRPTPRKQVLPPILNALNEAGIPDSAIRILIALGTHRPMTQSEIQNGLGDEVIARVVVENHDFRDASRLLDVGRTPMGTPIVINRRVLEADFVIGLGSIVPHPEAGWSGGAKILQPGVCGEETTAWTHMLAARQPDHLALAGDESNPVRLEIEQVARDSGLRFIVNVVLDGARNVAGVVAGDPVQAHRCGVGIARGIFMRRIPCRADAVVVDAYPADMDYWQGVKALAFATRAVKPGGAIVLVGDFPDGISPVYGEELRRAGRLSVEVLQAEERAGRLSPGVCTEALYLHASIRRLANVFCVSKEISPAEKHALGFAHADTVSSALRASLGTDLDRACVGIILQGGHMLPVPMEG